MYTVGEMARKMGVAPSTLRYYDKEGLLPFVNRSSGGARVFEEGDYEWLSIIECLKKTGMKLSDIREFVEMAMRGDETAGERLELIRKQKQIVEEKIAELEETARILEFKEWYYETAVACGSSSVPRDMPTEELPEKFRSIRKKLRGR